MDYEPLTFAEKKVIEDVERMFGDKDIALKNIMIYTRLLEINPDDAELKMNLEKVRVKMRKMNECIVNNIEKELKCKVDRNGEIFTMSNVYHGSHLQK